MVDDDYASRVAQALAKVDDAHRVALEAELARVREQARIERELAAKLAAAKAAADAAEAKRIEDELRRVREAEAKRRAVIEAVQRIGQCPAGYGWHRSGNGWQCGGGSHFVSDSQLPRY